MAEDSAAGLVKNLTAVIPKLKTPVQLAGFGLVILLCVLQVSKGFSPFIIACALASIILIIFSTAIANRIEKGAKDDSHNLIFYLAMLLLIALIMFFGFRSQFSGGPLTWDGGHFEAYLNILQDKEHVSITLDDSLRDLVLCQGPEKFHGNTPDAILKDIAWRNRGCLKIISGPSGDNFRVAPGESKFARSSGDKCDTCSTPQ
jgi:hypothetical protein